MSMPKPSMHAFALFALLLCVGTAAAETVNCTAITSLPAVINVQGIHCLTGNLDTAITNGIAINITANNVVLDLNGFKLGGLGGGTATQALGISGVQRQNITIKNGTIRGFHTAIDLAGNNSQGHVIEDIRADSNRFTGFRVEGTGNIVRNNQVVATGGWTLFQIADAMAMQIAGSGVRVVNNDIIQVTPAGVGIGRGIFLSAATGALVVNNRITSVSKGIEFDAFAGTGKYRDNLTFDVTTPFTGGTAVGTND